MKNVLLFVYKETFFHIIKNVIIPIGYFMLFSHQFDHSKLAAYLAVHLHSALFCIHHNRLFLSGLLICVLKCCSALQSGAFWTRKNYSSIYYMAYIYMTKLHEQWTQKMHMHYRVSNLTVTYSSAPYS